MLGVTTETDEVIAGEDALATANFGRDKIRSERSLVGKTSKGEEDGSEGDAELHRGILTRTRCTGG